MEFSEMQKMKQLRCYACLESGHIARFCQYNPYPFSERGYLTNEGFATDTNNGEDERCLIDFSSEDAAVGSKEPITDNAKVECSSTDIFSHPVEAPSTRPGSQAPAENSQGISTGGNSPDPGSQAGHRHGASLSGLKDIRHYVGASRLIQPAGVSMNLSTNYQTEQEEAESGTEEKKSRNGNCGENTEKDKGKTVVISSSSSCSSSSSSSSSSSQLTPSAATTSKNSKLSFADVARHAARLKALGISEEDADLFFGIEVGPEIADSATPTTLAPTAVDNAETNTTTTTTTTAAAATATSPAITTNKETDPHAPKFWIKDGAHRVRVKDVNKKRRGKKGRPDQWDVTRYLAG